MCGIAGILNLDSAASPVRDDELRRMSATLVHRGPDDEGCHVAPQGTCGLGFRRLAIIDLETGGQPIANEDQSVWLVFNGEIYNFRELRAGLERAGHRFRSRGDSEVIVHLYEEHGERCFEHLAGMFAVALWDQRRRRLVLARDRFGKKPLVYAELDGRLYFASEAKAILAVNPRAARLDAQSLHRYLLFQYVPAPWSIYENFRKLPPGCRVEVAGGRVSEPRRYYDLLPRGHFEGSYRQALARLDALLHQAVEKRLVADVPLGAFLSGGVDSSVVVALMRELGAEPLRTFCVGFADPRYDETAYARMVARHVGSEHHEQVVTPAACEVVEKLAWYYDEPFGDSSAVATYYVARHARQWVTVALTGDAGDECFLGYDRYRAAALAGRFDRLPGRLRRALASAAWLLPHGRARSATNRAYRFLRALGSDGARRYLSWVNVFTPADLAAGYRTDFARQIDPAEPLEWFNTLYGADATASAAERANLADWRSYLPFDLLTKVDIASMACSLECRVPLLDHELVEFALSLPAEWRRGKRILKDWARGRVPDAVLERGKMGFGVPVGEWFRGELREMLTGNLLADEALCGQVFDSGWLRALIDRHLSGHANHAHMLWSLLMLECWWRRHGRPGR